MNTASRVRVGGSGPPLVLVHGVGLDLTMWDEVASTLENAHRVIRYDLLGHGESPDPADPRTLDDFTHQLLGVMDGENVSRACVAGISLGGLIALSFASRYPARVERLALLNTVFSRSAQEREGVKQRLEAVEASGINAMVDAALERWFNDEWRAEHPKRVTRLRTILSGNQREAYLKAYRIFANYEPQDAAFNFSALTMPTLVMTGELDAGSTPAMAHALARNVAKRVRPVTPRLAPFTANRRSGALRQSVTAIYRSAFGDDLMQHFQLYIDGGFSNASDDGCIETQNPATGEKWATASAATEADVNRAVAAAHKALHQGEWQTMNATQRGKLLTRLADLLTESAAELGEIETRDSGKLLAETRTQTAYVADYYRYYGGLADKIQGATLPIDKPEMQVFTVREPIGVVAAIVAMERRHVFNRHKTRAGVGGWQHHRHQGLGGSVRNPARICTRDRCGRIPTRSRQFDQRLRRTLRARLDEPPRRQSRSVHRRTRRGAESRGQHRVQLRSPVIGTRRQITHGDLLMMRIWKVH